MTDKRHERAIIQGKLFPATGTRKPLPRPRLDSSSDVLDGIFPVVVVAAPAGYGKSTLMARWHARLLERGVSCAWLSLDEDDNDAARFLRHLIAALRKASASAHIGKDVAEDLIADFASGSRSVLEAIAGDLAQVQHRIVLFLDDLQLVEGPEVRGILDWLINYAPRSLQYVIGTRQDPGLRLSGLRVRCQLLELGAEQLQFDAAEAAQFYRSRLGRDLPALDLQTLLTKTEGWPAALELAALVLAGSSEPKAFIQHFAGTDTSVVDYLCDMVLSQMDERTRDIVFRISMFDRICAPLARAVTDANDAEEALLDLRTRNLFLIPLDRSWEWVRFHHLVGEFFRETYRRTAPAQARECLVRGAQWLHANDHIEEAVNYMIRAQEWERCDTLDRRQCGGTRLSLRVPPDDPALDERPSGGLRRSLPGHPYPVRLCALVLPPVSGLRSADLPPAATAAESRGARPSRRRHDRRVALCSRNAGRHVACPAR